MLQLSALLSSSRLIEFLMQSGAPIFLSKAGFYGVDSSAYSSLTLKKKFFPVRFVFVIAQ